MRRTALFVGVNNYLDKGINNLSCAVNDASATAEHFAAKGFETHLMTDSEVSLLSIREKISSICKTLKAGDVFVFYFSGHGHEAGDNHFLLCPATASQTLDIDGGGDAISLAVVRHFSESGCEAGVHRLFILDCCRNNVRAGAKSVFAASAGKGIELVKKDNHDGILPPWILRSCQAGQRSFEDVSQGHGYFTLALEQALNEEQVRSFSEFFETLKKKMVKFVHPGEQRITLGEYSGDPFPLFPEWESAAPVPAAAPAAAAAPVPPAERPLSEEERASFFALREELNLFYTKEISHLEFPEKLQQKISRVRRLLEKLQNVRPGEKALQDLKMLQEDLEYLKKTDQLKKECQELNKKADLELKVLKDANAELPQEIKNLHAAADRAFDGGDWEAALPLYQAFYAALLTEREKLTPEYLDELTALKKAKGSGICFSGDNKVITYCKSKDITEALIPGCVTMIAENAFRGSRGLTSLVIPDSVTVIGSSAFEGCSDLTSLQLPSAASVGKRAFARCEKLKEVIFSGAAPDLSSPQWESVFEGCNDLELCKKPISAPVRLRAPAPAPAPAPVSVRAPAPAPAPPRGKPVAAPLPAGNCRQKKGGKTALVLALLGGLGLLAFAVVYLLQRIAE